MSKFYIKAAKALMLMTVLSLMAVACAPTAAPEPTDEPAAVEEVTTETESSEAGEETEAEEISEEEVEETKTQVFIGTNGMTGKHYNPLWMTSNPQFMTFPLILPALTWFDSEVQPVPDLAEEIEINEDATVYTFHLPEDAVWSDGEPLTADDVYFTYKLAVNPELGQSVWENNFSDIVGLEAYKSGEAEEIEGITVVDDHTVKMELSVPNATFLSNTYLSILPEHILGGMSVEELEQSEYVDAPTITSGPYDFVEFSPGQYIHLAKKDGYWGEEAQIDEVFVKMFEEQATILAQLEAGELDIATIPADEVERFEGMGQIEITPVKGIGYLVAHVDARSQEQIDQMNKPADEGGKGGNVMNGKPIESEIKPYLQDQSFRQAMMYAIDNQAVIDVLVDGYGTPIYSPMFGPEWAVNPDLNTYDRDVDKAKALMEEAGVTFAENGTAMWDDESITLVFLASTGEQARQLGEMLQQMLGEVGIRVDIKLVTSSSFLVAAIGGEGDLILNAGGRFGTDPSVSSLYYTCSAGWAELVMGYCNEEFDQLMKDGVATSVIEERQAISYEASAMLNEDLPSLFFMTPDVFYGVNPNLAGVEPSPDQGYVTWNIEEWTITE
ncbi:MAG: ABC transporter substrate-binding protein [Anaerolineales bacterium]|nr:ABC transporter substrate-binding protein [Anaerolineales bacterium]